MDQIPKWENQMSDDNDNGTSTDDGVDDDEAQRLLAGAINGSGTETGSDTTDWKAEAQRLSADLKKWQHTARRNELSAKNAEKSVQDQIAELRNQIAERDTAYVEANSKRAMAQVQAQLADAGLKRDDVAAILEGYDPTALLSDGEPNEEAIAKLATSLTKVAGRVQPDHDQGRKGGQAAPNMNDLIRRAAGIRIN